jgi:hypothetical protein
MEKLLIIKSSIDDIVKNLDIVLNSPNDKVPIPLDTPTETDTDILFVCFCCNGVGLHSDWCPWLAHEKNKKEARFLSTCCRNSGYHKSDCQVLRDKTIKELQYLIFLSQKRLNILFPGQFQCNPHKQVRILECKEI